jgi:hypothetical protein
VQDLRLSQRSAENSNLLGRYFLSIGKLFLTLYQSTRHNIPEDLNGRIEYNFETEGFIFSIICKPNTFIDYWKIIICSFGITSCYLFANHGILVTSFVPFVKGHCHYQFQCHSTNMFIESNTYQQ